MHRFQFFHRVQNSWQSDSGQQKRAARAQHHSRPRIAAHQKLVTRQCENTED